MFIFLVACVSIVQIPEFYAVGQARVQGDLRDRFSGPQKWDSILLKENPLDEMQIFGETGVINSWNNLIHQFLGSS
jgi:hypothetical protein